MPHYSHDPAITDPDPPAVAGEGPLPGRILGPAEQPSPSVWVAPAELPDTLPYPDPHLPE